MSKYAGETAGLAYGAELDKQREAQGLQQRQLNDQRLQAIRATQVPEYNVAQRGLPKEPPEPKQEKQGKATQEHFDLADYIHGVSMGVPQEAEKKFKMVQPGTTMVNKDGSISFTSIEGHPVTITKEQVDIAKGFKQFRERDEVGEQKALADIEKTKKETALLGQPKQPSIEQKVVIENTLGNLKTAVENARQEHETAISNFKKKDSPENGLAMKNAGLKLQQTLMRLAEVKNAISAEQSAGLPMQPPIQTPPPEVPVSRGVGQMSMGGKSVTVKDVQRDPAHDAYNLIDKALNSGRHPKTGQPLTSAEKMLAQEKLKELKKQMLGKE